MCDGEKIAAFFGMPRWIELIDLLFVMKCDPSKSIEREYASQLTRKRGTIMTEKVLVQLNSAINISFSNYGARFKRVLTIDTSQTDQGETARAIAQETLKALGSVLAESKNLVPSATVSG